MIYTRRSEADELREQVNEKNGEIEGVRSAMDGFGEGEPNLDTLQNFFDAVKEAIQYE